MIAAEDLMIGNYVMLNTDYTLPDWHQITAKDICDIAKNNLPKGVSIEPIPLTPDVLERLGFEKDKYDVLKHHILKCRWITEKITGDKIDVPFLRFDSIIKPPMPCVDIYYLHQLQNLYKALTGKNLKFKTT